MWKSYNILVLNIILGHFMKHRKYLNTHSNLLNVFHRI